MGSAYISRDFATLCRAEAVRHLRTRPYRPRTNGKAERSIKTLLAETTSALRATWSRRSRVQARAAAGVAFHTTHFVALHGHVPHIRNGAWVGTGACWPTPRPSTAASGSRRPLGGRGPMVRARPRLSGRGRW